MPLSSEQPVRFRLAQPILGTEELAAVERVFASGILTGGAETESFETEFALTHNARFGVAMSNGTVALAAILLAMGIGPGDEVITPSFTFLSTATCIRHVGATPRFVDVKKPCFNLDPEAAAAAIGPRTRAIIAVHYGGQPADLDDLRALADRHGLALIEDAAEAHGATYRGAPVGTAGNASMFSFTPTKNMTMGEGGIVLTNDSDLTDKLRRLRNHGQIDGSGNGSIGYNWRLTEMQAAIGRVQLTRLAGVITDKVQAAKEFSAALVKVPGITPPVALDDRTHVYMLYTATVDDQRDRLIGRLLDNGVEARLYFSPVHLDPLFGDLPRADLPVTDWLGNHAISLPFHRRLSTDDLHEIARLVTASVTG